MFACGFALFAVFAARKGWRKLRFADGCIVMYAAADESGRRQGYIQLVGKFLLEVQGMERILVVEDDLALSTGLCFELDSAGYLTVAAYNCAKARYLLDAERFSLAILDVNLPDGNGFDLCREIKAARPELPVIFLTANDLEADVLNGFDMGAEDYVTKPFNMQILLRRVEVALRRGKPAAPPADRWSDGFFRPDRPAGRGEARHHPERVQTAQDPHRPRRPDPDPPAALGAAVGQRRQFHRRPHADGDYEPAESKDRG